VWSDVITLPDASPVTVSLRSPGRYLLGLAARQSRSLLAATLLGSIWMLSQAAVPVVVGRTLDAGVIRADRGALLTGCLVLVALGVTAALSGVMRHRLAVSNWLQASLRTRQLIGHHVADHGLIVGSAITTGEVVQSASTDSSRIGDVFDIMARGAGAVVSYLAVSVLLVRMDVVLGLWVVLGVPLLSATMTVIIGPLRDRQSSHRDTEGELTALGADTVAGLRVLRGIGGEEQFLNRYRVQSQQVRRAGVRVAGLQAALEAAHVLLPGFFIVALTWLGAHAVLEHRLSVGDLVTVYGYGAFLRLPLETGTEVLSKWILARVAAARAIAILSTSSGTTALPDAVAELPLPEPGAPIHDPLSGLTLTSGEMVGLVTAQPEDAIRLTNRLVRLESDSAGPNRTHVEPSSAEPTAQSSSSARIGDVPVDRLSLQAVRERVLLSESEPRLFTGPLRREIDPSGRHSDAAVRRALEIADADDVLSALPEGLDTTVEERGRQFSGGQRQRLVLARAVLADPEVLVLVEPTSAVDAHTEARIGHRLKAARRGRTTLITTASPLLLDLCDQVAFMTGGRVSARGTHRELLRESEQYRRVVIRGEDEEDVA
jgi:ABC-type multidrug transport system fused ATPase/permease subunit